MQNVIMLKVIMLNVIMLNVIMPNVILLNDIVLNVIMLSVMGRTQASTLTSTLVIDIAGNTKGGSITLPVTSCLTGLESAV
jgi:hypothetical protein